MIWNLSAAVVQIFSCVEENLVDYVDLFFSFLLC